MGWPNINFTMIQIPKIKFFIAFFITPTMKALVLAGGYARRLAPITDFVAKPLLPLGDKLVIDWVIDKIREIKVDEVAVSTNNYYKKEFEYWSKCRAENIKLIIEPTHGEEEKFGAIAGINYAMDMMGDDDYIIVAGDNVFDFSMKEFFEFYNKVKAPVLAVYDVKDREKAKRYGVVKINDEGRVVKMQEKPQNPESTLASTACYIFPKGTKKLIEEYLGEKNNPDSPGYFIAWLSQNHEVYAHPFSGLWKDIGNLDEYRSVFNQFL